MGVAQEGDAASGEITVVKIDAADTVTYNYSSANQDKIAAWMPGDTVTLFIDHHHHGDHHHAQTILFLLSSKYNLSLYHFTFPAVPFYNA